MKLCQLLRTLPLFACRRCSLVCMRTFSSALLMRCSYSEDDWTTPQFVCERVCASEKLINKIGAPAKARWGGSKGVHQTALIFDVCTSIGDKGARSHMHMRAHAAPASRASPSCVCVHAGGNPQQLCDGVRRNR